MRNPTKYILGAACALLLSTAASADVPQVGPMTKGGVCIVSITDVAARSIATWCGITDTTKGQAGFVVVNMNNAVVCLGDESLDTSVAIGGHCFSVCADTAACPSKTQPVRGSIHTWKLRAAVATTVTVLYGATP